MRWKRRIYRGFILSGEQASIVRDRIGSDIAMVVCCRPLDSTICHSFASFLLQRGTPVKVTAAAFGRANPAIPQLVIST
jgi:hypothetical protein